MNAFTKIAFAVAAVATCIGFAQKGAPEQATALIGKAQAEAKRDNKAVFVVFDASW